MAIENAAKMKAEGCLSQVKSGLEKWNTNMSCTCMIVGVKAEKSEW